MLCRFRALCSKDLKPLNTEAQRCGERQESSNGAYLVFSVFPLFLRVSVLRGLVVKDFFVFYFLLLFVFLEIEP